MALVCTLAYPVGILAMTVYQTRLAIRSSSSAGYVAGRRFRFLLFRFRPDCCHWSSIYLLLRHLSLALVPVVGPEAFLAVSRAYAALKW